MSDVLLLHGAWHGAWAWAAVIERLGSARVHAPDLPGCGADAPNLSPEICLQDHITAAIPAAPSVICAHSYGGILARAIADTHPQRTRALILIEALWPEDGQSAMDCLAPAARTRFEAAIAEQGEGWRLPPPDAAAFDLPDPALRDQINRQMRDHPARTFREPLAIQRSGPVGTYIIARDRDPQPYTATAQRLEAGGWRIIVTDGGHELPLTRPDLIAQTILDAA